MTEREDLEAEKRNVLVQVAERQEMAAKKDIYKKLEFVAENLGQKIKTDGGEEGDYIHFELTTKTIFIGSYGNGLITVTERKDEEPYFFYAKNRNKEAISNYIPGEWENKLDLLVAKAEDTIKENEMAKKEKERNNKLNEIKRLKDRFGL